MGWEIMRIAIADDEADVRQFLQRIIADLGYTATCFSDGDQIAQALIRETFDLVILDWTMPGKDGITMLKWMEEAMTERPPVIIMTNRTAKQDISDALNAGADDYITKPEDPSVIAARINALLRRSAGSGAFDAEATYGKYSLNRIEQTISFDNQAVTLTAKEFELADLFFRNADRTLSRNYIMESIWRTTATLATRTLDMHISRVRSKLELTPANGFRIFTVFGYGYRLETLPIKPNSLRALLKGNTAMRVLIWGLMLFLSALSVPALSAVEIDGAVQYQIKKGDTLINIADRYLLSREQYRILQSRNRINNPLALPVGSKLTIDRRLMRFTPSQARIVAVRGRVSASGGLVRVDQQLGEGTRLITAAGSFVTLQLENGSKIAIPSNSDITIRLLRRYVLGDTLDYDFDLAKGDIRSSVTPMKSPDDRYRVRTPKAVSAVRGTDFQSRYDPANNQDFAEVVEGKLAVGINPAADPLAVAAGNGLSVNAANTVIEEVLLAAPTLMEPGKIQADPALLFVPIATSDAKGYRLSLASDAGFMNQIADIRIQTDSARFDGIPDGNYFIRARAISANGIEGMPATFGFKRRLNGVSASAGKADDGYRFKWTSEGDGVRRFHFQLLKDTTDGLPMVAEPGLSAGLSGGDIRISDLPPGTYFWRVGAVQYLDGELGVNWTGFEKIAISVP